MASGSVIMFPGQGSQHVGMGQEVLDRYPDLCEEAGDAVGYDIRALCLRDEHGRLEQTAYTQQAVYFVSCLAYLDHAERVEDEQVRYLIGHSLGLYPALFAAGVFGLVDGLRVVAKRGDLMQQVRNGAMLAVIGSHVAEIEDRLAGADVFDVDVANYNCPDQVVLSGTKARLAELVPRLEQAAYRCVPLAVSGAFHSRHMEPCRREFARYLLDREFAAPTKTVISTTSGHIVDSQHLMEEMTYQMVRPVRWWQTVAHLAEHGSTRFVEIGPGTVLTKLNAKILGGEPK